MLSRVIVLQRKLELRNEHQRTKFFGNDIRLDWVMPRKVESERLTIRKSWMPSAKVPVSDCDKLLW